MADYDRLHVEPADDPGVVLDDVVDAVPGDALGILPGFLDRAGVTRPPRRRRCVPGSRKRSIHAPHESACSQSPWTKTTGVVSAPASDMIALLT